MKFYYVYILRTSSNTLYVGQTNNLRTRIKQHKNKKGSKYIKYFTSFDLVCYEEFASRIEAMKREIQIKSWSKAKKESLILDDKSSLI